MGSRYHVKVTPDLTTDSTGRMGVHAVGAIVNSLGWFFREQPTSDFGVDAHVEAPDTFGSASGRLLALQIKAGKRWFREQLNDGVVYRGSLRHLAYWRQHSLPVVLVLYDPSTRRCLWQEVTTEKIEPTSKGWKLFVPFKQELDNTALKAWWRLCTTNVPSLKSPVNMFEKSAPGATILRFSRAYCEVNLHKVGKRYRPELYVQRQPDDFVWQWLTDENAVNASSLILVERAGSGKTNLICHLTQRLIDAGTPCVLLLGSDPLDNRLSLTFEVLRALGLEPGSGERIVPAIQELAEALRGQSLCILLDAINETRDVELMQNALADLLAWLKPLPVRILISCRDIYWHFLKGNWIDVVDSEIRSLDLYKYDLESWPEVRNRYLTAFNIRGSLSGDAEEKCRHPLLFRFFCEAYEGEDVSEVTQIRLKPLFERYLQKKVQRVAAESQSLFRAEQAITTTLQGIASEMLLTSEMSIPEARIPTLMGEPQYLRRDSIYVRLLDEDIILEEIPDSRSSDLVRRVRFVYEAFLEFMLARAMTLRWRDKSNEEVIGDLLTLLEPGAGLKNTLGALYFLSDLFVERKLSLWRILAERGPAWQSLVLSYLRECDVESLDSLHKEAFPILLNAPRFETRVGAVELLESSATRRVLDPRNQRVFARFESDERREVRLAALEVLSIVWEELTAKQRLRLAEAVLDHSRAIRRAGMELIGRMKRAELKRFITVLEQALLSSQGRIRSYAAMAMRLSKWPQARDALLHSLQDPNPWVRRAGLIRLQEFSRMEDVPAILPLLADPEPKVRSLAAILCSKWQYSEFVEPLLARINVETNGTVLSRLVQALISINSVNSSEIISLLRRLLGHENYWVRSHAGKGLYQILDLQSLDDLVPSFATHQPMGGWFRAWPNIDEIGGALGVLRLCKSSFVNTEFGEETGAFISGLFTPKAMRDKQIEPPLIDWLLEAFMQLPVNLAEKFLSGLRFAQSNILDSEPARLQRLWSNILLNGPEVLRPYSCYFLAANGDSLDTSELDFVLKHHSTELREQLAWGIVASGQELRKDTYFDDEYIKAMNLTKGWGDDIKAISSTGDLSDDDIPF